MKTGEKFLSLLLSVVMVLGVCAVAPVTINAADDGIVWNAASSGSFSFYKHIKYRIRDISLNGNQNTGYRL